MAQPTLTFGTTVITLPYPDAQSAPTDLPSVSGSAWRSLGGNLHVQTMARWCDYAMRFLRKDRAIFDSIVAMRDQAQGTGWIVFTWPEGFPRATGVQVFLEVSAAQLFIDPDLVTWDLKITEIDPH